MTGKFTRLSHAWAEFANLASLRSISVSLDNKAAATFLADDESFYLYKEGDWWVVDRTDDRGKRYTATAKFSNFELLEKYLIWRWGSTARSAFSLESLGPPLYKMGFSSNVTVAPTENQWKTEIKSAAGSAILGQPYSTIFSHLMSKSIDEINEMVRAGFPT
ncbi:Imm61 family immunity protein [[Mycobacterium] holstebronense]|uniref:Uncharacterized protein n=1 Tax=[Mycobacterium] holstebronense TaxID=3064288 RepID=A0ABN9NNX8_9MYCO|nr:Imm61 family immunity protein [Mycolicibacter sp. MU0102]CAJ1509817.1 hypothetical protein MU0102_003867 [Mycolicibacter sp. MU0102]